MCVANGAQCSTGGTCANNMCMPGKTSQCGGGMPFPTFDKTCLNPAGCFVGMHQLNCCGSQLAIGVSFVEQQAFMSAEMSWEASCPGCVCPARLPEAEDGKMCMAANIYVLCDAGKCTTHCK
jgi:hypothetical protein